MAAIDQDRDARRRQGLADGYDGERMALVQRARILAAMVEVACERGFRDVTVAHVVERAGVSRRTFYQLFADGEDCSLAALDEAIADVSERVLAGWEAAAGNWADRVRGGLLGLLAYLEDEPSVARLLIVESLGGGAPALARRERAIEQVVAAIDSARHEPKAVQGLSPMTAEGIAGAVLSVLHARLTRPPTEERAPDRLVELAGQLMSMIVLPYLGPVAARRELRRPPPKAARVSPRALAERNPLTELRMRLTYRTVRVLVAVAEHPCSSNRMVAQAAEISDQGQTSKLLARLEGLGLIENVGAGAARGAANAWALTEKGQRIRGALGAQAA